ncbi:MAG: hypothetical protein K5855_05330 [Oscillospiraceae bacterium]|jgi:hypothetical protein|nr:hypothetical protein [Oscillospiraceae bacterium]
MNTILQTEAGRGISRRLRKKNGYSIAEALLATLIVALLSAGIAAGTAFAVRQYNYSVSVSESKVLCSTLSNILRSELGTTKTISVNGAGQVISIRPSKNYSVAGDAGTETEKLSVLRTELNGTESSYGELMLDDRPLLPSGAYTSYRLRAKADVTYDEDEKLFHVTLSIRTADGEERVSSSFVVMPLNEVNVLPPD